MLDIMFLCLLCLSAASGFLLEPDVTINQTGNIQYLSVNSFLSEKKELEREIDHVKYENFKLKQEYQQSLQILTSQLQQRLSVIDSEIKAISAQNYSEEVRTWERKYIDLSENYTKLQERHKELENKYQRQQLEIRELRNSSLEISNKLKELQQTSGSPQDVKLQNIQHDVQSLKQKTSFLEANQNRQNVDFMALYNETIASEKTIISLKNVMNMRFESQNQTMQTIEREVMAISTKVVMVACTSAAIKGNSSVKFDRIVTKTGFNNITSFKSTGKFTCETPGFYYISAYLRSQTLGNEYYIMKNSDMISYSARAVFSDGPSLLSTSLNAVVDVQKNDELYVQVYDTYPYGYFNSEGALSCMAIIKIC